MKKNFTVLTTAFFLFFSGEIFSQQKFGKNFDKEEKEFHEDPAGRLEHEFQRLRDPKTNEIPYNIKARELQFVKKILRREDKNSSKEKNSLLAQTWENLGPRNQGGRTRTLAIDIKNEKNILAGAVSGGMWRTIDGGQSWVKTTAPNEDQTVSCIAQDKRAGKTSTWYYGTGELLSTNDRRVTTLTRTLTTGDGIYKSTDNGASWRPLESTKKGTDGILSENFQGVWDIAVDNSNQTQDEIYAACYGGIMRSTNGGSTWNLVLGDTQEKSFSSDIAILPSGVSYAAISSARDGSPSSKQGFWRSEDGLNWVNITPADFPAEVRTVVIASAQSNPNVLYFLTDTPFRNSQGQIPNWTDSQHQLWRYTYISGDGNGAGGSWQKLTQNLPGAGTGSISDLKAFNSIGGYALDIAIKPDDENFILLAGTNLYRSTDGFSSNNFQHLAGYPYSWEPGQLHPDIHKVKFSLSDPKQTFIASDGGVATTDNITTDLVEWKNINDGYVSTQFYSVSIDPVEAGDEFVMGGLQDNGTMYFPEQPGSSDWALLAGGDGMNCAVLPSKKQLLFSVQGGNIYNASEDTSIGKLFKPNVSAFYNFYTNFVLDKKTYNKLYLPARNRLFRYNDLSAILPGGQSTPDSNWQEMTKISSQIPPNRAITAVASSKEDILFIGTDAGKVYRVDEASTDSYFATDITDTQFPQNGFVASIDVDEEDSEKIIAVFSNYNVQSIFLSEDGGGSWTPVGGNLDASPDAGAAGPSVRAVRSMKYGNGRIYFAATSVGLFSTTQLAGTNTEWLQEGATTIGNVQVEAIDARSSDGTVVIGTYGNGVYRARLSATSAVEENFSPEEKISLEQNYPNPVSTKSEIKFSLAAPASISLKLYNPLGEEVATLLEKNFSSGYFSYEIDVTNNSALKFLPNGTYFYRLQTDKLAATRILQIQR